MSGVPQLDNKVSVEDIDVELYKTRVAELAEVEKPSETELPEGEFTTHIMGNDQHTITFKIDNTGTDLNLNAQSTFADWGSFSASPSNVLARRVENDVCHVSENRGFFTGAAGMIGYSITSNDKHVYLRLAATDPYWSVRSNRTMVALYSTDDGINQARYNAIYDWGDSATIGFDGKTLKVQGNIGSGNNCTAMFTITWT